MTNAFSDEGSVKVGGAEVPQGVPAHVAKMWSSDDFVRMQVPLARKGHALVALGAATAALFGGDDLGAAAAKAQAERDARDARAAARGSRHANVQQGTLSARSGAAGATGVSGGASASSAATQRMLFDDLDLLTLAEPAIEETDWADGSADEAAS